MEKILVLFAVFTVAFSSAIRDTDSRASKGLKNGEIYEANFFMAKKPVSDELRRTKLRSGGMNRRIYSISPPNLGVDPINTNFANIFNPPVQQQIKRRIAASPIKNSGKSPQQNSNRRPATSSTATRPKPQSGLSQRPNMDRRPATSSTATRPNTFSGISPKQNKNQPTTTTTRRPQKYGTSKNLPGTSDVNKQNTGSDTSTPAKEPSPTFLDQAMQGGKAAFGFVNDVGLPAYKQFMGTPAPITPAENTDGLNSAGQSNDGNGLGTGGSDTTSNVGNDSESNLGNNSGSNNNEDNPDGATNNARKARKRFRY